MERMLQDSAFIEILALILGNMYISQIFLFLGVATNNMIKIKTNFYFYRRKVAPNRTRFKEARLVAYASLQKFSKYTYYLGLRSKFL